MGRLIDEDMLIDELIEQLKTAAGRQIASLVKNDHNGVIMAQTMQATLTKAIMTAKTLPPADDTVNVLRCRDCEYLQADAAEDGGVCRGCSRFRQNDDYCSRGKRRAEE